MLMFRGTINDDRVRREDLEGLMKQENFKLSKLCLTFSLYLILSNKVVLKSSTDAIFKHKNI